MKFNKTIFMVLFCASVHASAQTTGAFDAVIFEQLVQNGKTAYDTLKKASEQYEKLKKMEAIQKAREARKMYRDARELQEMFKNSKALANKIEGLDMNGFDAMFGGKDADWYMREYENISNNPNKKKAYGAFLMKLNMLEFLYKSNESTIKDKTVGTNERDDKRHTATNTMIMSKILLENEGRELTKIKNDTDIVNNVIIGTSSYSSLAESNRKKNQKKVKAN